MSYKPHHILGLNQPSLKRESEAEFVVIKPKENWTYDPEHGESLSRNYPMDNYRFTNKIIFTTSAGRIAFQSIDIKI